MTQASAHTNTSVHTGAHLWRGVIHEYADRLPSLAGAPIITLCEGGTPLIRAAHLSALVGAEVFVKYEGVNPTGSFKDRGMTTATRALRRPPTPPRPV
jgi:threonine synthase